MPPPVSPLPLLLLLLCCSPSFVFPSSSDQPPSATPTAFVDQHLPNLNSSSESIWLCSDGKGPLLEGEERIFPCAGECPGGFDCEFPQGKQRGGICCPNLDELYRLYREESRELEETDRGGEDRDRREEDREKDMKKELKRPKKEQEQQEQNKQKHRDGDRDMPAGVNAMALLEQHYGQGIARPPKPLPLAPSSQTPPVSESVNLVHSRSVEIRRSQPKSFYRLPAANDFVWRPRASATQHSAKTLAVPSTASKAHGRSIDASGEEYSCRRQRLELFCKDRRRQTQFVLRWYAKEGVCVSYPWGYCSGTPVASDPTLRTREECELLCTDTLDAGPELRFGEEESGGGGGDKTVGGGGAENGAPVDLSKPDEFEMVSASASVMPPPPADDELSPPAESTEGPEGPFAGAAVAASQNVEVAGPEGQSPVAPETTNLSASSAEFSEFLLAEQRRQPKKRCMKVTPYRSMCPDGMPSQFTLRWHVRGTACFAYPYGYCHGEIVMAEEPIKTEQECLEACVGGGRRTHRAQRKQWRRHH